MAQKKLDAFKMETRFDGLIKLLAEGLYSEKDIFVRELIQNAHDSIVRRKEDEPSLAGRIDVHYDTTKQTISFTDNGIGMDEKDIRQFLSVIGATGTGSVREQGGGLSEELIGQFGIGMLSAFVVAEKVYADTKKKGTQDAFQWRNSGSEECELYSSDWNDVGSRITVFLRDDYSFFLAQKKLQEIIIRYCDFIAIPIYLNGIGPINSVEAPWNRVYASPEAQRDAYHDFINRRFSDFSLDEFPINITGKYHAKGILYISDRHVPGINADGLLDIFIRRMLVKQKDTSLLPEWAKFVRGVIDSPDLKPTAARDNVQASDPSFEFIREQLGKQIVERLSWLAENNPKRFQTINEWHHYHLKGMAFFHDAFFRSVADMLLFNTNRGMMSLRDYLPKNEPLPDGRAPIYFFAYNDSAAQYYRMADEKGLIVINAGDRFDEELLKKYAQEYDNRAELRQFDVLTDGVLFEPLSPDEAARFTDLEEAFTYTLSRSGSSVRVEVKRFAPVDIPAVIVEPARTKAEENLRALLTNPSIRRSVEDSWNELLQTQQRKPRLLALNAGNALVEGLLHVRDRRLLDQTILAIYNNALMYAHRLDEDNMTIVHGSMVGMMRKAVELYQQGEDLRAKLEEARRTNIKTRTEVSMPEHIRVFMITPYDKKFKNVETAVRNVLENAPYFFEVRLARDYTHSGGELVDDLQKHILESHAFLADITELNPNVMMEVGAVRLIKDSRPLLVIKSESEKRKVSDLGDKIWISYGEATDSVEMIEERIRQKLEGEGRIKNGDIEVLLSQRKKRFLAASVLRQVSVRLNEASIAVIRKQYHTIEDLLAIEPTAENAQKLHLRDYQLQGIISELTEKVEDSK